MANPTIRVQNNGPLVVSPEVELRDARGVRFQTSAKPTALCRCGGSGNKPFCDGTHAKVGFKSEVNAPK